MSISSGMSCPSMPFFSFPKSGWWEFLSNHSASQGVTDHSDLCTKNAQRYLDLVTFRQTQSALLFRCAASNRESNATSL
jgi:hypothetical protein